MLGQADPLEPFPGDVPNLGEAEVLIEGDVLGQAPVRARLQLAQSAAGRLLLGQTSSSLAI